MRVNVECCRFVDEVRELNYRAVLRRASEVETPMEAYWVVRSALVLGEYAEARVLLESSVKLDRESFFYRFLHLQLRGYEEIEVSSTIGLLLDLRHEIPNDDVMVAEHAFVVGYLYNRADAYASGVRYHRRAADLYHSKGFVGCEAHALFNLCVSFNHLNERRALEETFLRLETLVSPLEGHRAQMPWKRMQAYRHVDREEYAAALSVLGPLLEMCRRERRMRDLGGLSCLALYLSLKLGHDAPEETIPSSEEMEAFHKNHAATLGELLFLARNGLMERTVVAQCLSRWKRLAIDSVNRLFLLSVLADRIVRGREFEDLLEVARRGSKLSLRSQQVLSLVDFRYYEALALFRLGWHTQAQRVLALYKADALQDGSSVRVQAAKDVEKLMSKTTSEEIADEQPSSLQLVLYPEMHSVSIDGRSVSLLRKPTIQQLLLLLVRTDRPIPIDEVFYELYGTPFHPERHARRLHSLIDRTRRLLGSSTCIVRSEKQISLAPFMITRIETSRPSDWNVVKRRGQLLSFIQRARKPLTISQLESHFRCCRRTLQLDLRNLVEVKAILSMGGTRMRKYFRLEAQ